MIKVSKNICFEIIGSYCTSNIIAICKTIVTTEPIYRTYCGIYPFSPDFKAFSFSISRSEVGTEGKKEGIRLHVFLDFFLYVFFI